MIITEISDGQGLGNQLWSYVVTRTLALDKNVDFGIQNPEKWKGSKFLHIDFGQEVVGGQMDKITQVKALPEDIKFYYSERQVVHPITGQDIRIYDKDLVSIPDSTKIDGYMQDEQYIIHRKDEIREWLKIDPMYDIKDYASDDICVINFRGGEYIYIKDVFLTKKYWEQAMRQMLSINPKMRFVVITDDETTARKFFPNCEIPQKFGLEKDYAIIHNAHYLILSNSSFAWFPAWTSTNLKFCIAPKYWAGHNISDGYWSLSGSLTKGWVYQDRNGLLFNYDECKNELENYIAKNQNYFTQTKIINNFLVVSNYYNDISWIPRYTDNYIIYDQSTTTIHPPKIDNGKIIKSIHKGHNIRDYCTFIIDNYENLPETTIFATGNVFGRHVSELCFSKIMNNEIFTPIFEPKRHKTRKPIAFISEDGMYNEYNNSWYVKKYPSKYFKSYNDFINFCFVNSTTPEYTRFAPGANYVVPKSNILKLPKMFYENLRFFVSHCEGVPAEAHIIERALYTIWHDDHIVSESMKVKIREDFEGIPKKTTIKTLLKIPQNTYIRFTALTYRVIEKLEYIKNKLPKFLDYFKGKRQFSTLLTRDEIKPFINLYKNTVMTTNQISGKVYRKIKNIILTKKNALLSKTQKSLSEETKGEILEYRKKIKVYDVFNFFNELELLEIRLNILDPYVDYFVIVESPLTHSGKEKELFYEKNKERFKTFEHKIIHYVIERPLQDFDDTEQRLSEENISELERIILTQALTSDNIPKGMNHFLRDFYEKESVKKALVGLNDDDFCFVSDLDEIWNPEILIDYRKDYVYKFKQTVYCYYLNNKSDEKWAGTIATKYKNIKNDCLNHLRWVNRTSHTFVNNGGWHFTYQGGKDRVIKKLEAFSHQEFNNDKIKSNTVERFKENKDAVGRNFNFWTEESDLPAYLKENKGTYKNLFK